MLIRVDETNILNVEKVISLCTSFEETPPVIRKGWFGSEYVVTPSETRYTLTFEYICTMQKSHRQYTMSSSSSRNIKEAAKKIADQVMKVDPDFIDAEFEREVLGAQ